MAEHYNILPVSARIEMGPDMPFDIQIWAVVVLALTGAKGDRSFRYRRDSGAIGGFLSVKAILL